MFGFLNVYKPQGITSHDVVSYFRKLIKIKQIGHTGTLDPFAEGVLPICIGKATRLIEYLSDDKAYLAEIQFGKNTDSYDLTGNVIETFNTKVSIEDVLVHLKKFNGEIEQIPPIYSAIKVKGKKLYEYARQGKSVEVKSRKVFINKIELKSFCEQEQMAEIYVECSKGTYIRSIAYDLGKFLNCGGYLKKLTRTKAGKFEVNSSVTMNEFSSLKDIEKNLIKPAEMLDYPKYELNDEEHKHIITGQTICNKNINNADIAILFYNNEVRAVACVNDGIIKVKKVFYEN